MDSQDRLWCHISNALTVLWTFRSCYFLNITSNVILKQLCLILYFYASIAFTSVVHFSWHSLNLYTFYLSLICAYYSCVCILKTCQCVYFDFLLTWIWFQLINCLSLCNYIHLNWSCIINSHRTIMTSWNEVTVSHFNQIWYCFFILINLWYLNPFWSEVSLRVILYHGDSKVQSWLYSNLMKHVKLLSNQIYTKRKLQLVRNHRLWHFRQ